MTKPFFKTTISYEQLLTTQWIVSCTWQTWRSNRRRHKPGSASQSRFRPSNPASANNAVSIFRSIIIINPHQVLWVSHIVAVHARQRLNRPPIFRPFTSLTLISASLTLPEKKSCFWCHIPIPRYSSQRSEKENGKFLKGIERKEILGTFDEERICSFTTLLPDHWISRYFQFDSV